MRHRAGRRSAIALVSVCLLSQLGCTRTWNPPREPVSGYAVRDQKIPLRVGLHLTDELRKAKWERPSAVVVPIGESLVKNSTVLARHVFREVVDGQGTAANPGSLDAVLTPRLVYMNRTEGVSGWGEAIMAIKIEWSLTRAGGQPIWIETVGGQATGLSGPTDPEKILKQCIDDVFLRSEKAISESIAIRSFAASR